MGKVITPGVNVRVTTATKTASRVGGYRHNVHAGGI